MKKKVSYINKIEFYLPKKIEKNIDILKMDNLRAKKLIKKIGIDSRHISNLDETSIDLGFKSALKILKNTKKNIDFLIFCTQTPNYLIPTNACILQEKLSLPKDMGGIDIIQGCSGYNYSLSYAQGLVESGQAKQVLIINSDVYSKFTNKNDYTTRILFGDGSASTIVSNKKTIGSYLIINSKMGTDGSGYKHLILENLGVKNHNNIKIGGDYIYMNGGKIFEFAARVVPLAINSLIKQEKINITKIDYFIFHQANQFIIDHLKNKMKIPQDKILIKLKKTGNTVSSSIPITLKYFDNKIKKGSLVLLIGFGVGLSWGTTLLKKF